IGSTVVVLLAHEDQCACLWVGDSRIYRLRDGQLEQLTRDHSHVQELVDQGLLSPDEAHRHPLANVITRAVGSSDDLQIDEMTYELQAGDIFLLCSDGLNKAVSDEEIAHLLAHSNDNCQEAVKAFIHLALMRDASDNVTTVVVSISGDRIPSTGEPSDSGIPEDPIPADWYL
ncbi:MAG: serine/threonine-protein phosphatase, partial [Candidatus Competibacteraceae bacterium]|nr:serine/threonine-protein phosphatase [Candidatus Competibacteraceae bacterium]